MLTRILSNGRSYAADPLSWGRGSVLRSKGIHFQMLIRVWCRIFRGKTGGAERAQLLRLAAPSTIVQMF